MHQYRVGEFAALTGVSVRTLHHYDRIGLLPPSSHSEAGYRLYSQEDLLRLQQILTLRYLGFPLRRIGELLDGEDFDLLASMRIQRRALRDRIRELERIERSLEDLVDEKLSRGQWDWQLVIDASISVQEGLKGENMNEYYTPEEMRREFEQLSQEMGPGEVRAIERQWAELLAEVQANRHLDPASAEARALADRWQALVTATFQGREKLAASVAQGYRQGRYDEVEGAPRPEDFAFIAAVEEARKK